MRLAYERGFLTKPNLSFFQWWALLYTVNQQKAERAESTDAMVRGMTLALAPQRFQEMYLPPRDPTLGDGEENITAGELKNVEQYLRELDRKRSMTASQAPEPRWTEWQ